jgi:hypothetical protein
MHKSPSSPSVVNRFWPHRTIRLLIRRLQAHPDRCRTGSRCATPKGGTMTNDISVVDADAVVQAVPSRRDQRGMVSAEWAVGIIAAVAIAGVLLGIVTSGPVHDALLDFILMVIRSFSGSIQ